MWSGKKNYILSKMAKKKNDKAFDKRYLLALIPLLLTGWMVYYFSDIFIYLILGWVVSMIGAPLMSFLRKYLGKNIAAAITLSVFVMVFVLLIWIFIPPISKQAQNLAKIDYTELINSLEEPINDWKEWMENKGLLAKHSAPPKKEEPKTRFYTKMLPLDSLVRDSTLAGNTIVLQINIDPLQNEESPKDEEVEKSFFEKSRDNLYQILNPAMIPRFFGSLVGTLGSFIIGFMSVMFIAFFFLREQGLFNVMVSSVIPDKYVSKTVQAINESSKLLIRYFIGVLLQVTILTIFVSISLGLLGVKNSLLIGLFAALINIIPYIGPLLGAAFAMILTISGHLDLSFYDEMLPLLVKVGLVFLVMQLFDNFILQPNIFGKSVKAHPLEIFLIVLIGAQVAGIPGMVLAIPLYTVIRVIAKTFLGEFKVVKMLTKGMDD